MAEDLTALVRAMIVTLVMTLAGSTAAVAQEGRGVGAYLWWSQSEPRSGVGQLLRTAQDLPRMTTVAAGTALAARVSQEGHWTFVNMAGETFTAANDGEVKRGLEILLPDRGERRMLVILTGDSIFERGKLLSQLPGTADLALGWGDETFNVTLARGTGTGTAVYVAELKPGLLIELNTEAAFAEAMQLLRRPLSREGFRILSLAPGGPRAFSPTPRIDRATGKAEIDTIDPAFLAAALGNLRGQTAVLTGRSGDGTLTIKPASGAEQTMAMDGIVAAAAAGDVNLLVLKASSTQQPGGRNWLWQRVAVKGLETALGHATLADFFAALGGAESRLVLRVETPNAARTMMILSPADARLSVASTTAKLGSVVSEAVSGLVGNVTLQGATASFTSASRQMELDRRLLPYIPSAVQLLYGGLLVLGLFGAPQSWRWWTRLWPAEKATEYANVFGLWAARGARGLFYGALFMPLAAIAAAPMNLASTIGRLIGRPLRVADRKA